jgi:hypothetical protein
MTPCASRHCPTTTWDCLICRQWVAHYGGYHNIPPEAWAWWQRLYEGYRKMQRLDGREARTPVKNQLAACFLLAGKNPVRRLAVSLGHCVVRERPRISAAAAVRC